MTKVLTSGAGYLAIKLFCLFLIASEIDAVRYPRRSKRVLASKTQPTVDQVAQIPLQNADFNSRITGIPLELIRQARERVEKGEEPIPTVQRIEPARYHPDNIGTGVAPYYPDDLRGNIQSGETIPNVPPVPSGPLSPRRLTDIVSNIPTPSQTLSTISSDLSHINNVPLRSWESANILDQESEQGSYFDGSAEEDEESGYLFDYDLEQYKLIKEFKIEASALATQSTQTDNNEICINYVKLLIKYLDTNLDLEAPDRLESIKSLIGAGIRVLTENKGVLVTKPKSVEHLEQCLTIDPYTPEKFTTPTPEWKNQLESS